MRTILTHVLFIGLVVGGGSLIGLFNIPGEWYATLTKPWFNPPNWVFGPVWTVLYVMIGIAGARTWQERPAGLAMQIWFGQLALNFLWTPVFFGYQMIGLALAVVLALVGLNIAFVLASWPRNRVAALLFLPYVAWVAYASLLNAAILWLNPAA